MPTTGDRPRSILDLALDRFATQGYDATSIGELASELGITKSAITYHFPSKSDILEALVRPLLDELDALLSQHRDVASTRAAADLLERYVDVMMRHRRVAIWLDTDRVFSARTEMGRRRMRLNEQLIDRLGGRGTAAGRVRGAASLGTILRPLRVLENDELGAQRDVLVSAALAVARPDGERSAAE